MAENENGAGQVAIDDDYEAFKTWKAERAALAEASKPKDPELYVHLANGDVERMKESELTNRNHYVKEGYAHHIIGVYPVEDRTVES